jgi:hypothetical protein
VTDEKITPGSPGAIRRGCVCPMIDNNHGDGYRGRADEFMIRGDCPVHASRERGKIVLRSLREEDS